MSQRLYCRDMLLRFSFCAFSIGQGSNSTCKIATVSRGKSMAIQRTRCNFAQPLVQPLHLMSLDCFSFAAFPHSHSQVTTHFPFLQCHSFVISHVIFHGPFLSKPRPHTDLIRHFLPHRVCFLCSFPHSVSPLPSECVNAGGQGSLLLCAEQNPGTRR